MLRGSMHPGLHVEEGFGAGEVQDLLGSFSSLESSLEEEDLARGRGVRR